MQSRFLNGDRTELSDTEFYKQIDTLWTSVAQTELYTPCANTHCIAKFGKRTFSGDLPDTAFYNKFDELLKEELLCMKCCEKRAFCEIGSGATKEHKNTISKTEMSEFNVKKEDYRCGDSCMCAFSLKLKK